MKEESLNLKPQEGKKPSMNEHQSRNFLIGKRIHPLDGSSLRPGQPFIFLFTDAVREKILTEYTPENKPCFALVLNPMRINYDVGGEVHSFDNAGEIRYYAINPINERITLVKTSQNPNRYNIHEGDLFQPSEGFFD